MKMSNEELIELGTLLSRSTGKWDCPIPRIKIRQLLTIAGYYNTLYDSLKDIMINFQIEKDAE